MTASADTERQARWGVHDLLEKYTWLRIVPTATEDLLLAGRLAFECQCSSELSVHDEYNIEIRLPSGFPVKLPRVREIDGRIPKGYHKLVGDLLCLGAPTAIRLRLKTSPLLITLVEEFIIPYLAGYTHFAATGRMLFGELSHGERGIREYIAELFRSPMVDGSEAFIRLASFAKRRANKFLCPCASNRRLGKCHNRIVNGLRRAVGRKWFAAEYDRVLMQLPSAVRNRRN